MSADTDPVVAELADFVTRAAGLLRAEFNAAAAELGLPPAQALALANLHSPAPMRRLAEWLSCEASNVTGIVDGLERRGLVTRQADSADRRVKHLVLTEEGKRQREVLGARSNARAASLFDLPDADRRTLRDLLARTVSAPAAP